MQKAVGFVLAQQGAHLICINVNGFPDLMSKTGVFISPQQNAAPIKFELDTSWHLGVAGELVQGLFQRRTVDFCQSDPAIARADLAGGFVCGPEDGLSVVCHEARFVFFHPSAVRLETEERYEHLLHPSDRDRSVQTNIWYPIKLGSEPNNACYGVFRLSTFDGTKYGEGLLRFVYNAMWNPGVTQAQFARFGRPVGEVSW
jgi:hypothetical protein